MDYLFKCIPDPGRPALRDAGSALAEVHMYGNKLSSSLLVAQACVGGLQKAAVFICKDYLISLEVAALEEKRTGFNVIFLDCCGSSCDGKQRNSAEACPT